MVITDRALAARILVLMSAPKFAVALAIAGTASLGLAFINPIAGSTPLPVMLVSGKALTAAVIFLVLAIGVALVWALYKEWKVVARGKARFPDGTELSGEIILEKQGVEEPRLLRNK
jgi:hypothetical protein